MKYKSIVIIFISTVFSCKEEGRIISNTNRSITQNDFLETRNLSGTLLQNISDSLFIPNTIYIDGDYLFISERTSDDIMHIVKVPDDEYLRIRGTRGAGPGELLNSWKFFSPGNGAIGVFDPELGKAVLYNMDTLLNKNKHQSEYVHRDMLYSNGVTVQGNELYFLSNLNKPEARLYSFDLTKKEDSVKQYGELPTLNQPYPHLSPADEREILSHAKLTHKDNLLVLSYYNIPLVEIYDLSHDGKLSVSGPDELPSPDLFGDIRYYYGSYISDKYIYLLYIENKTEFSFTSSAVFILGHDGTPVKKLVLDREIFQMAVYEDQFLYGLIHAEEGSEFSLVKFSID